MKVTKMAALAAVAVMVCGTFYGCAENIPSGVSSQASTFSETISTPAASIVGTWKPDHLIVDGKTKSFNDWVEEQMKQQTWESSLSLEDSGKLVETMTSSLEGISFAFQEDGTLSSTGIFLGGGSVSTDGTYEVRGNKVLYVLEGESGELVFDAKAGTLTEQEEDGMKLVLKKEPLH